MKIALFILLCSPLLGEHSDDFKRSQRIFPSELFISGPEVIQLVFYYPLQGVLENDKQAVAYLIEKRHVRAPTKDEYELFLDMYDTKYISKEAVRLKLPLENLRFVIIVNQRVASAALFYTMWISVTLFTKLDKKPQENNIRLRVAEL